MQYLGETLASGRYECDALNPKLCLPHTTVSPETKAALGQALLNFGCDQQRVVASNRKRTSNKIRHVAGSLDGDLCRVPEGSR